MQANDLKSWAWPRACGSDYRPRHLILNVLIQICSLLRITNTLLESELMGKDSGQAACCGRNTIFEWRERHALQTAESCICRSSCRWRRMRSATRGSMINEAMRMREPPAQEIGRTRPSGHMTPSAGTCPKRSGRFSSATSDSRIGSRCRSLHIKTRFDKINFGVMKQTGYIHLCGTG